MRSRLQAAVTLATVLNGNATATDIPTGTTITLNLTDPVIPAEYLPKTMVLAEFHDILGGVLGLAVVPVQQANWQPVEVSIPEKYRVHSLSLKRCEV